MFAGKSSVELRMVAGLAQIPLRTRRRRSEGGVWRQAGSGISEDCPALRLNLKVPRSRPQQLTFDLCGPFMFSFP